MPDLVPKVNVDTSLHLFEGSCNKDFELIQNISAAMEKDFRTVSENVKNEMIVGSKVKGSILKDININVFYA